MKKLTTMRTALSDPRYFGSSDMMGGDSWRAWRTILLACMGEPLTDDEREIFTTLTGRTAEPTEPVRELTAVVGRRGGKSRATGVLAAFLAGCVDHRPVLAPGQRGRLAIIAPTREQASEVMGYTLGCFEQSPALKPLIGSIADQTLSLKSRIDIQVRALSFRNLRGATNIGVICDEIAYWRSDESATPDKEVIDAITPSLATTGGPLIKISSPYAKKGVFYQSFQRDYGPEGRPSRLVARAPTQTMNPSIDPEFLADAYANDPVSAAAEYGAEWRGEISDFINPEVVAAATVPNRDELPPVAGTKYICFVDIATGSGTDSFTAAIAHSRKIEGSNERAAVLDLIFEAKPPFSPDAIIERICEIVKQYDIRMVVGDNFGGELYKERFQVRGIKYEPSSRKHVPSMSKSGDSGPLFRSEVYKQFLSLINSGRVELLDHRKTITQLISLERHVTSSGSDSISHPKYGHDDCINAAAGACVLAAHERTPMVISPQAMEEIRIGTQRANYLRSQGLYGTELYKAMGRPYRGY